MNKEEPKDQLLPRALVEATYKRKMTKTAFYADLQQYELMFMLNPATDTSGLISDNTTLSLNEQFFRLKDGSGAVFTDKKAIQDGGYEPDEIVLLIGAAASVLSNFTGSDVLINPFSAYTVRIPAAKVKQLAVADTTKPNPDDRLFEELTDLLTEGAPGDTTAREQADETLAMLEQLKHLVETEDEDMQGGFLNFQTPKKKPQQLISAVKQHLQDYGGINSAYYARVKLPSFISNVPLEFFFVEVDVDDPDAFYDELEAVVSPHLEKGLAFDLSLMNQHTDPEYSA
ncbi:MAG: enhanced serine sensitivity protein SseB C-terminal domain-containing protein, partial [Bacteroidota bacterium]